MTKEKVKEILIDIYGVTVFTSALIMTAIALTLAVLSVLFVLDEEVIRPALSIAIAGTLLYYSFLLIRQIE